MIRKGALIVAAIIVVIAITVGLYASGMDDQISSGGGGGINSNIAEVVIKSDGAWSADIKDNESRSHLVDGFGDRTIPITCNSDGTYSLTVQRSDGGSGTLNVQVVSDGTDGSSSQRSTTTSANGIISLSGTC
jgi:hypothetical protein